MGLLSVATMPVAIAATRWSQAYTLIDAAFAIPIGVALGVLAVVLARRGRLRIDRTLGRTGGRRQAATGRLLGILGFCLAVTGAISVGVYVIIKVAVG